MEKISLIVNLGLKYEMEPFFHLLISLYIVNKSMIAI